MESSERNNISWKDKNVEMDEVITPKSERKKLIRRKLILSHINLLISCLVRQALTKFQQPTVSTNSNE